MTWVGFEIILFFLFTILAGFFAGTEVAYTGLNLSQIKRIHQLKPNYFSLWEKRPDLVLAVLLLSNNAVGTAVGVLAAHASTQYHPLFYEKEAITTIVFGFLSGLVLLVFGEMLPKIYAKKFTLAWALTVTPLMNLWTRLLTPIAEISVRMINGILKFQRAKTVDTQIPIEDELKNILEHSTIPVTSRKILKNVIDFSQTQVKELMTARSQIISLSAKDPIPKIIHAVIQSGFSRIPVYSGQFDNIVGVLYSKDLLVSWRSNSLFLLEDLLRPVYFVEETQAMNQVMRVFRTGRHHLAIVKDNLEKGRVTGLLTLQDALEALVGPIEEEL